VSKIKGKTVFSILVSKLIIKASNFFFKGGSNFPGRVALRLDNSVLKTVSTGYKVIIVTGTNGKTTTTSMIYNMLKDSGKSTITNNTGANMLPGITSCFINHFRFKKSNEDRYAVIEVDEANLKLVTEFITPKIITVTNLFRDQLDRYGEVYTTFSKILEGIEKVPSTALILNGDESLLGDLGLQNPVSYYGFNVGVQEGQNVDINADSKFCKVCKKPYKYNFITYNHLGSFYCESCGYKRPELDYHVDKIVSLSSNGSLVNINGFEYYINQAGIYNIYNGLCALSIAKALDLENKIIFNSLKSQKSSFGRQEKVFIGDKEINIVLVKNPAGFDQGLSTLAIENKNVTIALLLNDNYADGRDVSWIWDVKFEMLKDININKVIFSGIRLYDMAIRIKTAGIEADKFVMCETDSELLKTVIENENVYVFATYTAMLNFRKLLYRNGYIRKKW
jgi:lipid II isoglutaminyl synthase (glutamine-hydrolysing)